MGKNKKFKKACNGKCPVCPISECHFWHWNTGGHKFRPFKAAGEAFGAEIDKAIDYNAKAVVKAEECHKQGTVVFEAQGVRVSASAGGSSLDKAPVKADEILLDLLDGKVHTENGKVTVEPGTYIGDWIQPYAKTHQRISFDWPDMGVMDLPKEFYLGLIEECKATKRHLHVACYGGHGRTGTVVAILAGLMGVTKTDPVAFVREKYCKQAVEAECQLRLVEKVTGIAVKEKPSKTTTAYSYSGGGYGGSYGGYYGYGTEGKKPPIAVTIPSDGETKDKPHTPYFGTVVCNTLLCPICGGNVNPTGFCTSCKNLIVRPYQGVPAKKEG